MKRRSSPEAVLRALASFPPRIFRWAVDTTLVASIVAFALLFILQFTHSPKLLHFIWVAELKSAGDPLVAKIDSWVGPGWPVDTGFSFIPLAMAFLMWLVKIGVDAIFLKVHAVFSRPCRPSLSPRRGRPIPHAAYRCSRNLLRLAPGVRLEPTALRGQGGG